MPVVATTGAVLGQGVDMPVVYNERGHGPDSAVPGQGCCYARCFTTGAHGSRRAENVWRCRRCRTALLGTSL